MDNKQLHPNVKGKGCKISLTLDNASIYLQVLSVSFKIPIRGLLHAMFAPHVHTGCSMSLLVSLVNRVVDVLEKSDSFILRYITNNYIYHLFAKYSLCGF